MAATGPVGPAGVVVEDSRRRRPGWFYFKVRAGAPITIRVRNLNGRCGGRIPIRTT